MYYKMNKYNNRMGQYYDAVVKGYRLIIYDDNGLNIKVCNCESVKELIDKIPKDRVWIFQTLRSCTSTMEHPPQTYDVWINEPKDHIFSCER